jgi:hypothetical protein
MRTPAPMHSRAPIPSIVRWKVTLRAKGRCEDCGQRRPLELHHRTYWTKNVHSSWREPIFGYEKESDLAALCRDCHYGRHIDNPDGVFWSDPEEMHEHYAR